MSKCARCSRKNYTPLVFPGRYISEQYDRVAGDLYVTSDGRIFAYRNRAVIVHYCRDCSAKLRYCRICGCTEERGCLPAPGSGHPTCFWVENDLCSNCFDPDEDNGGLLALMLAGWLPDEAKQISLTHAHVEDIAATCDRECTDMSKANDYRSPAPEPLGRYTFSCVGCGRVLSAAPSIAILMGVNTGHAECPGCKTFLHLEITPDLHGCMMISEAHDVWFARTYPDVAARGKE